MCSGGRFNDSCKALREFGKESQGSYTATEGYTNHRSTGRRLQTAGARRSQSRAILIIDSIQRNIKNSSWTVKAAATTVSMQNIGNSIGTLRLRFQQSWNQQRGRRNWHRSNMSDDSSKKVRPTLAAPAKASKYFIFSRCLTMVPVVWGMEYAAWCTMEPNEDNQTP